MGELTPELETNALPPPRNVAGPLLVMLAAGLALRLALWVWFDGRDLCIWDERDYDQIAVNLVTRGEYALTPGEPTSLRPPLYPCFLAGVYGFFGVAERAAAQQAVRLIQGAISLLTVLLVYRLGATVSRRAGLWAAGLVCFYPSLVGYTNLLLTETLFTFLLCAACLALVRFLKDGCLAAAVGAGFLIGLAALARSVMWLFPPVAVVYLLVATQARFPRRLAGAGAFLAAFALTIAPWSIRNTQLEKSFVTIDTMGGRNFMMSNYEHTPMYRSWDAVAVPGADAWGQLLAARHPGFSDLTQGQRDKLAFREGVRFVLDNPGLTLQRDLIRFFNFWQLERVLVAAAQRGYFGDLPKSATLGLAAVICGCYAAAILSGIFGMVLTPPPWRMHGLLLLVLAYINGMHVLTFAHSRYHLPLMPLVLIYSALAFTNARPIWQERRRLAFWLAAALAAVLVGSWLWEMLIVDFSRFRDLFLSMN